MKICQAIRNALTYKAVPACVGLLSIMMSGCQTQQHLEPSDIRTLPYSTNQNYVPGLRAALSESGNMPTRVLIIHGMITNTPNYSTEFQAHLAEKLGLQKINQADETTVVVRGYDFTPVVGPQPLPGTQALPTSELRKSVWVDPKNPTAARLVFYEMLWSPMRDFVKNNFLACFESRNQETLKNCPPLDKGLRNEDSRSLVNGALKDGILIDGFADAVIVLGPVGDVLRDDVSLVMCKIASDTLVDAGISLPQDSKSRCSLAALARDKKLSQEAGLTLSKVKFFGLTHSLGSFLFLDTQQRFAQTRVVAEKNASALDGDQLQETLLFFLTDQSTVYMRANQISLLQLARFSAEGCTPHDGKTQCPNRLLRKRPAQEEDIMPLGSMTKIVAFNDVDDLLGFELPPYLATTGFFGALVNVSVKNPGFHVPKLFKLPSAAHTGHDKNPAVVEAIIEGIHMTPR